MLTFFWHKLGIFFAAQSPSGLCSTLLWGTWCAAVTAGVKQVLYVLSNSFGCLGAPAKGLPLTSWRMVFCSYCCVSRGLNCLRSFLSGGKHNLHRLCSCGSCSMRAHSVEGTREPFPSAVLYSSAYYTLDPLVFSR